MVIVATMFSDTWHTLFGLLIIVLSGFGVVINVIALVILGRKKRQSAFNELLVILSVYDILVVLCGTLSYGFPNVSKDYSYYVLPRKVISEEKKNADFESSSVLVHAPDVQSFFYISSEVEGLYIFPSSSAFLSECIH